MPSQSLAHSGDHGLVSSDYSAPGSLSLDYHSEQPSINHDDFDLRDRHPLTPPHEPSWPTTSLDCSPAQSLAAAQTLQPAQQQQQEEEEGEDPAFVRIPIQRYHELQRNALQITEMCHEIAMAREEAMRLRAQTFHDRQEHLQKFKFLFDSQTKLTNKMSLFATNTTATPTHDILEAWTQERRVLEQDYEALLHHDSAARNCEAMLLQSDFKLNHQDTKLGDAVSDFIALLQDSNLTPAGAAAVLKRPSLPDQSTLPTRTPSPRIPLVLEIYYEKVGAVGWQTDRIYELEHEHRKDRSRRAFRQDKGETLSVTDDEFETDYRNVRSEAEDARQLAIDESSKAKQACLDQGIDPDEYRKPVPDWLEPNLVDRLEQSGTPMIELKDVEVPASPALPGTLGPQNAGVMDWIANTDLDNPYPFDVDRLEHVPSPRSWKSTRRSVHDLREEPTIKEAAIRNSVPTQFQFSLEPERTMSQPFLYGRNPRSWSLQLKRQPSDPGLRGSFTRNGLGQNTAFLGAAPLPGGFHPRPHKSPG